MPDSLHAQPHPTDDRPRRWLVFVSVALIQAALAWTYHDRYWYPSDEGIYAHLAERLLAGEVMNRSVESLHPGYINFINAGAMWLFGTDLLSMRYPLMLATLAQALLLYAALVRRGVVVAAAASLSLTALGTIQFLNPTAHWYCLLLAVALVWWMHVVPRDRWWRMIGAGAIVGCALLLRQLTGIWLAMALLTITAWEESRGGQSAIWLTRLLLAVAAVTLGLYLITAAGARPEAKLLAGVWPLAILAVTTVRTSVPNGTALLLLGRFTAGMLIAAAPLGLYLAWHGTFGLWFDDAVLSALRLTSLDYMRTARWLSLAPLLGLLQVLRPADPAMFVNGLYWMALPLLPLVNGTTILRRLASRNASDLRLPIVAAFYVLVSLHLEGSMYWYFSVGLALAACLQHAHDAGPWPRRVAVAGAAFLMIIAVHYHAGQSYSRSATERLQGVRTWTGSTELCQPMPRNSLRIEQNDCAPYGRVVELLRQQTPHGATIFALPSDAEFYFLADRRNPFRFYNSATGIRDREELDTVLRSLAQHPPAAVTFRPDDKFNTPASRRIIEWVRRTYRQMETIDGVEVYLRPAGRGWSTGLADARSHRSRDREH